MIKKTLHIIGLGNITRMDDGVAIHVIRELEELDLPQQVKVSDFGIGGVDVPLHLDRWKYGLIIDAIKSDNLKPGDVIEFDVSEDLLPDVQGLSSTHGFDVITALKLAYSIDDLSLPEKIILIGVQIKKIDGFGIELTTQVKNAIPIVINRIKEIISELVEI
ncbi:MAG: hydrogenase maturation protease [Asgard group archaeon]|nr:hydrogenase maturation protease [Asgard group archaeon]